ncbi:hypothetical protein MYCTH_2303862 [Thermothelomyces thermophilus ATCC 42464]|uniref:Protein kinase domain-containing protein n=1 Tax=Thermothelomyces thermophilus (strain ATCC 42464 / BCRC 31852 / DSM 1799) TaxID=573729 RepID=G2QDV6_THET4|nr:uncharacterized protein MYCTH_2303862 [Thermothelomyces thermophilus ATCC 42464]AEO57565.1 hypothetical protein MYCTH_2303862 [Thermothelomyces thermophilus ATCC 42464]
MLTLQLFLGYQELPNLDSTVFRNQRDVDRYLGLIFTSLEPRGRISDAAQRFVCGCLAYDSGKRPTARQAFYHDWLQSPASDRRTFKRLEAANVLSWRPQRVKYPVIENLTNKVCGRDCRDHPNRVKEGNNNEVSPHFMTSVPSGEDVRKEDKKDDESMRAHGGGGPTAW